MSIEAGLGTLWALAPALTGAAAPSPSPSPSQGPSELEVTPGLAGFLATFAVAAACVLLFLSLTRHLRRATRNAQERGLPIEEPKRIAFGRHPEAPGDAGPDRGADGGPDGEPGTGPHDGPRDDVDGPAGGRG
ncbi:hypothetical protein GCM10009809_04090 [Isoptericola hypogeus]|uniref:Uncharacterized protein n=1 Tax=Isoptericola hypogeus TaxID=300179 RepID=A0ABN2ISH9_9MICO